VNASGHVLHMHPQTLQPGERSMNVMTRPMPVPAVAQTPHLPITSPSFANTVLEVNGFWERRVRAEQVAVHDVGIGIDSQPKSRNSGPV
jgi:hypothetical protein